MAPMRAALFRIEAGGRLFEAASRLLPEERTQPACYNLLRAKLRPALADGERGGGGAGCHSRLAKLLLILASSPNFSCCVICGRRDDLVAFSGREGGAVCACVWRVHRPVCSV
jgi:recombinational DNA repair protein (RecF pathway)